ncbi:MAG: FAD/NAD(P)-binding oxidoreductase [Sedimenticola sp.]
MNSQRRRFIKAMGATAATAAFAPINVSAGSNYHVIVVGGGFAGATVAKYIRIWTGYAVDVTLIDAKPYHTSCVLSNLILNRRLPMSDLQISYDQLISNHGVRVINDKVTKIIPSSPAVKLKNGGEMGADKIVVATGIGFEKPAGLDSSKSPHAWIAGNQTVSLARKLGNMGVDDTFIMTIPKSPYRCPPGPYERACIVADYLQRKGYDTGDKAKVLVLDANSDIQAEKSTFSRAFNNLYGNILDYRTGVDLYGVDSDNGIVQTTAGEFQGTLLNIIPKQRATALVRKQNADLTGGGRWAPVDPTTYQSTLYDDIYIIGDSQGTNQPKSAHMANSQAKVCADAIVRSLSNQPTDTSERLENITTNSACYSPINSREASWLTANFAYNQSTGQMQLAHIGEAHKWNSENYQEMFTWAQNLFTDCFI